MRRKPRHNRRITPVFGVRRMSYRPYQKIERRKSRLIHVGRVPVGGDSPISVQTMTNTPTEDAAATIAQIRGLDPESSGCRHARRTRSARSARACARCRAGCAARTRTSRRQQMHWGPGGEECRFGREGSPIGRPTACRSSDPSRLGAFRPLSDQCTDHRCRSLNRALCFRWEAPGHERPASANGHRAERR